VNTWIEVYTRCVDGEYFRGAYCPRDGHSNDTSMEVASLVEAMRVEGTPPSLEAIVDRGFEGVLEDVIVVQVASPEAAPDWFTPGPHEIKIV
jgi:hypothetical protein